MRALSHGFGGKDDALRHHRLAPFIDRTAAVGAIVTTAGNIGDVEALVILIDQLDQDLDNKIDFDGGSF